MASAIVRIFEHWEVRLGIDPAHREQWVVRAERLLGQEDETALGDTDRLMLR